MATADEIRAQIAASTQELRQAIEDERDAVREKADADVRQQLRRELDEIRENTAMHQDMSRAYRSHRRLIDADQAGAHLRTEQEQPEKPLGLLEAHRAQGVMDCKADVKTGEIEWSIKGFSWLKDSLTQARTAFATSPAIDVCDHLFQLYYDHRKGQIGPRRQLGSLVIWHEGTSRSDGVVFRYKIWIKSRERGYVQWGNPGTVCTTSNADEMIFGPDVCEPPEVPSGIFGMSHAQLQTSEWVIDDVFTAKLEVQVRPESDIDEIEIFANSDKIEVPPSCLGDHLLLLLDEAVGGDVTFKVKGDSVKAHSQILSARSEVLKRLFSCGMQESTSKEVAIEDCEPLIFKAFLRYLYSDNFASVEDLITSDTSVTSDSSSDVACTTSASAKGTKLLMLQELLAVSHKYQVTRLQVWCELKLSELLSNEEACSVLLQAHLFEAKQLQEKCLDFIAANKNEVIKTQSFASLSQEWPLVSLKIFLRIANVSENSATTAMEVQENVRKRKRDGSDQYS